MNPISAKDSVNPRTRSDEKRLGLDPFDPSAYGRISVAVDLVLLTVEDGRLRAMLLQRSEEPARGRWALPGGFVRVDESLEGAARRVLTQKVALPEVFVEQLYTFGNVLRDPRMRVITVSHFALVEPAILRKALAAPTPEPLALMDLGVPWAREEGGAVAACGMNGEPLPLAFDHAQILGVAVKRLRGRLRYSPIAFELLPHEFTLRALQRVHESILARALNKDAFRRRVLASNEVVGTGRLETSVGHRPAELYRWSAAAMPGATRVPSASSRTDANEGRRSKRPPPRPSRDGDAMTS
jgi:8-oxo-dGTP diphosphatase